jgi:hypothetical protein
MRLLIYKVLLGLAVLCAASAPSFARYLCAINEVYECIAIEGCKRVSPKDANLAGVMILDVKKKQLSLSPLGGIPRTDTVENIIVTDDVILLYGTGKRKANRTFSAIISLQTGNLSAGLSTLDSSFALSGACSSDP